MARLFTDTEFTSFVNAELISIAFAINPNTHFYAILTDYDRNACSDFVEDNILPILFPERANVVGTTEEVSKAARAWVKERLAPDEQVHIAMDYIKDFDFAQRILTNYGTEKDLVIHPSWCNPTEDPVGQHEHTSYFLTPGRYRHNALDDALALRRAWAAVGNGMMVIDPLANQAKCRVG